MKKSLILASIFLLFSQFAVSAQVKEGEGDVIIAVNTESYNHTNLQVPCIRILNLKSLVPYTTCQYKSKKKKDDKIERHYRIFRIPAGDYEIIDYWFTANGQDRYFSPKSELGFKFTANPNELIYLGAWRSEPLEFAENIFTYKTRSATVTIRNLIEVEEPLIREWIEDKNIKIVNLTDDILKKSEIKLVNGVLFDEAGSDLEKMLSKEVASDGIAEKKLKNDVPKKYFQAPEEWGKNTSFDSGYYSEVVKMQAAEFFKGFKVHFGVKENSDKKIIYTLKTDQVEPTNKSERNVTIQYTPFDDVVGFEKLSTEDRFPPLRLPDFSVLEKNKKTLRGLFGMEYFSIKSGAFRDIVVNIKYEFLEQPKGFVVYIDRAYMYPKDEKKSSTLINDKLYCFQVEKKDLVFERGDYNIKYQDPVIHFNCSMSGKRPQIIVFNHHSQIFTLERESYLVKSKIYEVVTKYDDLK